MAANSFPLSFAEGTLEVNFVSTDMGLPWKDPVGSFLCLFFCLFYAYFYAYYSARLEILSKVFTDDLEFTDDLFHI